MSGLSVTVILISFWTTTTTTTATLTLTTTTTTRLEPELEQDPDIPDMLREVDPDYPEEEVREAVKNAPQQLKEFLEALGREHELPQTRSRRSADDFSVALCTMVRHTYRPKADRDGFRIANVGNHTVQTVTLMKCEHGGTADGHKMGHDIIKDVDHYCKQEWIKLPLVAYDLSTKELVIHAYEHPHGCAAYIK